MNNYEILYILDNTLADETKEALIAKFSAIVTDDGGSIENVDKWGTRKFAYEINDQKEGYYVLVNFSAQPTALAELERVMGITDGVVRQMIVRK